MRLHVIVDFFHIYYRYLFQLEKGKMKRLSFTVNNEEKDISNIYYPLKDIEGFRKKLESVGHDVTVSVCFDMPSARKDLDGLADGELEAATAYKSNRVKRLTDEDFGRINEIASLLRQAGHNVYQIFNFEADDLVSHLVKKYANDFDYSVIYTNDADLAVNINSKVGMMRHKVFKGYEAVDIKNYSEYFSKEYKCTIPYNSIMLFKCTCGDTSDKIQGIKGFGPKAFNKLIEYINNNLEVDWSIQGDYKSTFELLERCNGYLSDDAIQMAKDSLSVVRPLIIDEELDKFSAPINKSTVQLRETAYSIYNMKSLI